MKAKLIELGLCLTCALVPVALSTINAKSVPIPANELVRADRQFVEGRVTSRSEAALGVNGKAIAVVAETTFTKDGKPITVADIQLGDYVLAMVIKGTDGFLIAESIEVLARN
jgi:hypothetical protein